MEIISTIGFALSVIVTLFLGKGAAEKIIGTEEMLKNFEFMKLEKYRVLTGVGELIGAVLLCFPMTSLYGLLLVTSFMSAAVVLHLSLMGGNKTWVPMIIGVLAVISYFLRN